MSLIREGIENVRVVPLPDGVVGDGRSAVVSRSALVTWRSSNAGLFHQVYVNGRFAGATIDAEQRRLVVQTPCSLLAAVRVMVFAVQPAEAHIDFADELEPPEIDAGRVRLVLLRSQTLPLGATANVYFDNGTGTIDYTEPLNARPIRIWPCPQDKAGFGAARFAEGDFGWDSAASVGLGIGAFGRGQFGLDADAIEWVSPVLSLGTYRFGVRIADASAGEGPASETGPIVVVPAATPATGLDIASFDESTNQLTLNLTG
jgi:hypothetical protein